MAKIAKDTDGVNKAPEKSSDGQLRFGVQADYAVKHPFSDSPPAFDYINLEPQLHLSLPILLQGEVRCTACFEEARAQELLCDKRTCIYVFVCIDIYI